MDEEATEHGLGTVAGTILFRDRRLDQWIFLENSRFRVASQDQDEVPTTAGIPPQFRR